MGAPAVPGQSWDHKLAALMSQGCVSGFALLSHRGECIAACGVLEAEFATAADLPSPAAHQVMALFDPLREPEAQSVVLTLCGTRQQVFKRDAGAVWATAARQRSGSCYYSLGFGLLCVMLRRQQQPQPTLFSRLDAVCRELQR